MVDQDQKGFLQSARQHAIISFTVHDTGSGIAVAGIEQIFRPFFQAEKGAALNAGTGLGLTVSHEYAELLGAASVRRVSWTGA